MVLVGGNHKETEGQTDVGVQRLKNELNDFHSVV